MAEKHPLDCYTLLQPINSPTLRYQFLNILFEVDLDFSAKDYAYDSFFRRYHTLCTLAVSKTSEVEDITHHKLLRVINHLKQPEWKRREAILHLQNDPEFHYSTHLAPTVVDLAASAWLMLTIGEYPGDISYDEPIIWQASSVLHSAPSKSALALERAIERGISGVPSTSVIDYLFPPTHMTLDVVKLPQSFTAMHLEKIAGIEIRWTSNLADHLLLRDDDTKLLLFHQVSILELHAVSPTSPLPKALIEETLRTISLLLPPVLGERNPWLHKEAKSNRIDTRAGICKRLNSNERQIGRFTYWRDRLVLLKRTFDDAEPRNVRQLWNDDRKKTQWFTLWVAVLVFIITVFFGVVQSVAGIVQAWASVKGLKDEE